MNQYRVFASGQELGIYEGDSEQGAKDACAKDAGYSNEAEMVARLEMPSDLIAELISNP